MQIPVCHESVNAVLQRQHILGIVIARKPCDPNFCCYTENQAGSSNEATRLRRSAPSYEIIKWHLVVTDPCALSRSKHCVPAACALDFTAHQTACAFVFAALPAQVR